MKFKSVFARTLLLLWLTTHASFAVAQFEQRWMHKEAFISPAAHFDYGANFTHVANNGAVYVLQRTGDYSGQIYKLSSNGTLLWQTNHSALRVPLAMAVDADGNVYVTARADTTATQNVLAKLNTEGEFLWVVPTLHAEIVRVSLNGDIYTASANVWGYVVTRFSSDGAELWQSAENHGIHLGRPTDMEVDNAGSVYLTSMEFITTKFDATGQIIWWARDPALDSSGPSLLIPQGYDLALDALGNVYATGSTGTASNYNDIVTVKYNGEGQTVWTARYDGPEHGYDDAVALVLDAAGNTYVGGMGNGYDFLLIKYGPSGEQLWVSRFQDPQEYVDWPLALRLDASGDVLMFGSSHGLALLRFDSSGFRNATLRLATPGRSFESPIGFGLDTNGAVYLVGNSFGLNASGTQTDPTNTFTFTSRYDPVANPGAPHITNPPKHQTVVEGSNAVFTVQAEGSLPLRYQWRFNGIALQGETNNSLRIETLFSYNVGGYSVEVSNDSGATASPEAYLQMAPLPPPVVSIQVLNRVASEPRPGVASVNTARFLLKLSRPVYSGLTVYLRVSGTASNDLDYFLFPVSFISNGSNDVLGHVEVPLGARSVKLAVFPQLDEERERRESVILSLQPGIGYQLGRRKEATVVILPRNRNVPKPTANIDDAATRTNFP
jgi:hypothetical protein